MRLIISNPMDHAPIKLRRITPNSTQKEAIDAGVVGLWLMKIAFSYDLICRNLKS